MSKFDSQEVRLSRAFSLLDEPQRQTLLSFADFLATQSMQTNEPGDTEPRPKPTSIPRPEQETVVGGIKRLSASFYMLDKSKILHETSALMTQHMLQGRAAVEVIDELEQMFERYYQRYCEEQRDPEARS